MSAKGYWVEFAPNVWQWKEYKKPKERKED